jgi:hypothetical protein
MSASDRIAGVKLVPRALPAASSSTPSTSPVPEDHASREEWKLAQRRSADAQRDEELREVEQQRQAILARHGAAVSAANTATVERHAALDKNLAEEVRTTLWPLAASFAKADSTRRTTAGEIADAWRTLAAKTERQLGAALDWRWLALAMGAAHGLAAVLANEDALSFALTENAIPRACQYAILMITENATAPGVEEALVKLENASATCTARYHFQPNAWRLKQLLSHVTTAGMNAAALLPEPTPSAPEPRARPGRLMKMVRGWLNGEPVQTPVTPD